VTPWVTGRYGPCGPGLRDAPWDARTTERQEASVRSRFVILMFLQRISEIAAGKTVYDTVFINMSSKVEIACFCRCMHSRKSELICGFNCGAASSHYEPELAQTGGSGWSLAPLPTSPRDEV
jgi:hypothetical protein